VKGKERTKSLNICREGICEPEKYRHKHTPTQREREREVVKRKNGERDR
jgi:hypothetical protein